MATAVAAVFFGAVSAVFVYTITVTILDRPEGLLIALRVHRDDPGDLAGLADQAQHRAAGPERRVRRRRRASARARRRRPAAGAVHRQQARRGGRRGVPREVHGRAPRQPPATMARPRSSSRSRSPTPATSPPPSRSPPSTSAPTRSCARSAPACPNVLAAVLLAVSDQYSEPPHVYFEWSEKGPGRERAAVPLRRRGRRAAADARDPPPGRTRSGTPPSRPRRRLIRAVPGWPRRPSDPRTALRAVQVPPRALEGTRPHGAFLSLRALGGRTHPVDRGQDGQVPVPLGLRLDGSKHLQPVEHPRKLRRRCTSCPTWHAIDPESLVRAGTDGAGPRGGRPQPAHARIRSSKSLPACGPSHAPASRLDKAPPGGCRVSGSRQLSGGSGAGAMTTLVLRPTCFPVRPELGPCQFYEIDVMDRSRAGVRTVVIRRWDCRGSRG